MNTAYEPKKYEQEILKKWADAKISEPETKEKFLEKDGKKLSDNTFCVPIPPPNVTGQLHLGHAMMLVIQDIMTRYHRMNGTSALWLPGTDHAAIATETVVLKNLGESSREVFSRPEFLEKCFDHTAKTHATITNQVKQMGATCDFSRERFTMDLGMSNAVQKIFSDLYKQDLIVRGHRMVNWSTGAQSVLADDELEYEDQKDTFAYIKCGKFVMGTVRSETKCADSPLVLHPTEKYVVARFTPSLVAEPVEVSPASEEYVFSEVLFDDEERRNKIFNCLGEGEWKKISTHQGKEFEGEKFSAETYSGTRNFFVLCDDEVIDINKGTGAMTISVCHSADDYLLAKKYPEKLKNYYFEKVGFDGKMTKFAGELEGVEVKIARKRAFKIMKEKGLIVGEDKNYEHNVPLCYRTGCVVEPMISPQWFIDVNKEFDWQEGVGAVNASASTDSVSDALYLQNIEDMLKTQKKTGNDKTQYSNQKQWKIGKVSAKIQEILEITSPEISLSETVYAKVRGWIAEKPGHIDRVDADFWLLPIILKNIYRVYENKHINKRVILCEYDKKSYVLVLDISKPSNPIVVTFFYTKKSDVYDRKVIYKKRHLGGPANVPPCIISILRKDLIRLAAGFSSRKMPVYKQINELFDKSQENSSVCCESLQNKNPILRKSLKQLTSEAINRDETPAGNFKNNSGLIDLVPKRFNKIYDQWIDNLQDWCISRQIWWGHQIPIWYDEKGNQHVAREQKLLFTRHGESENNAKNLICGDTPLTEKGRQQARDLAKKLISENRNITKIILSPLERATETGQIIQKILEENNKNSGKTISIETWDFLAEFSAGKYDNTPVLPNGEKILKKMIEENEGDSVETLISRAQQFWEKISETHTSGEILIVSHQATTNFIFAVKDGATKENLLEHRTRWEMDNCEIKESLWMVKPENFENMRQDEDTLDTWFSSALWPFSTLGWPDKTPDFEKFFPTSVLETGHDILFFWVARMIMFSRFTTGKNPFSEVFLHGLVCDEKGKKMSKSKGNGIDPLLMIEKFGTDAVRMALIVGTTPGNQVNLGEKKIEGYRNFSNKLWNVSRYILALDNNEGRDTKFSIPTKNMSLPEKWILSKTQKLISEISDGIEAHKYGEVGQKLYDFTWNDVADWAIESAKSVNPENSQNIGNTLREVLTTLLKLLHPYIPFVTEQIWAEMGNLTILALEDFPEISQELIDEKAEEKFLVLQNVIGKIRSLRSASKVDPVKKITAVLTGENIEFLRENSATIILMGRLEKLEFLENIDSHTEEGVKDIISGTEIFLPISGMINAEDEAKRKQKELNDAKKILKNLEGRIANKKYMDNAPEKLVQQTIKQYEEVKAKILVLES